MDGPLRGRVAIVTGGGWNIGRAVATAYAGAGAAVLLASRSDARLAPAAAAIRAAGGRADHLAADLCDGSAAAAVVRRCLERFGRVDVLAALAGGGGVARSILGVEPTEFEAVWRQNVLTAFQAIRAALPEMLDRGSGVILTAAGGGALFPVPGGELCAYASAKAALCRLTDQLQADHLASGVRFNVLDPGHVAAGDAAAAARAAELALWLASDASAEIRGRIVSVHDDWWRQPQRVREVAATVHHYRLRRYDLF